MMHPQFSATLSEWKFTNWEKVPQIKQFSREIRI